MIDALYWVISFVTGGVLAVFFFGGLHWTIRRAAVSKRPAVIFALSGMIRPVVTLTVLWFVTGGDLLRIAICMAGFIIVRFFMIRRISKQGSEHPLKEHQNVVEPG